MSKESLRKLLLGVLLREGDAEHELGVALENVIMMSRCVCVYVCMYVCAFEGDAELELRVALENVIMMSRCVCIYVCMYVRLKGTPNMN